jgi:formate C-acetyltransferase
MATLAFRTILKLLKKRIEKDVEFRKEIYNKDTGFEFNSRILFTTEEGKDNISIIFDHGKVTVMKEPIKDSTIKFIFKDPKDLGKFYRRSSQKWMLMLLNNKFRYEGNLTDVARFSFLTGYLLQGSKKRFQKRQQNKVAKELIPFEEFSGWDNGARPITNKILGHIVDNVKYLEDPYLGKYSISDFNHLYYLKYRYFNTKGEICTERPKLLTDFCRKHGFLKEDGNDWHPELRQGKTLNYILNNKKPIIHEWDLLAGTTTTKEKGVILYPELGAIAFWPELYSIDKRRLNPYDIMQEDIDILNYEVFPYWSDRNVREYCRKMTGNPLSQQLDELWVLYFLWKVYAISHTIPDYPTVLNIGLEELKQQAITKQNSSNKDFYKGIELALQGLLDYSKNLSQEASRLANEIDDKNSTDLEKESKKHLERLAKICAKVPAYPAETLEEALNSMWITWIGLHHENMNAGLSLGRLDQSLQPFFEKDIEKITIPIEREEYIKRAIELVGAFFLKTADHLPLVPDAGNYLFGGASSTQAITVGGVDMHGNNAVNDMTYIILKAAEMICIRDPNLNARHHPKKNSKEFLDRLVEVNINTSATPSIHNDEQMIKALTIQNFALEDARTWAATGCVEPTICGQHFGHTNCMLLNTVAAMEMVLNNGYHPVISETKQIGPQTGDLSEFPTYEEFLNGYLKQLHFLVDNSVEYNNNLGKVHQILHPTPLLSSIIKGPMEKGKDLVEGAAKYNTSGVALVGLTDVIDSLKVVKTLVYDKKIVDLPTLNRVIKENFKSEFGQEIHKKIQRIPKFGSDDPECNEIGRGLVNYLYDDFLSYENYRGGKYLVGFWSMSNHVAFGSLSGALPSGRKANKAYTPGLTPAPGRKDELIQNIHSVASLDALKMPNNLAFNIKLVPNSNDTHEETVNYFNSYAKSYFDLGGMQMQFNVVSSDTLREAMVHPENYGWLIVRISGYNAYFVDLNKHMQLELIERTEYATH